MSILVVDCESQRTSKLYDWLIFSANLITHNGIMLHKSWKPRFSVDKGLLVNECIANIGIPLDSFPFCCINGFICFIFFWFIA